MPARDQQETFMNTKALAIAGLSALTMLAGHAEAKGCLKGAAVGGVAGHVAGHHGVLGAAAGCAIGSHRAAKQEKAAQAQQGATDRQQASRDRTAAR